LWRRAIFVGIDDWRIAPHVRRRALIPVIIWVGAAGQQQYREDEPPTHNIPQHVATAEA
jgi:hypothetical protein